MKMIKITTDNKVSVVECGNDFRSMAEEIGAQYIEIARLREYPELSGFVISGDWRMVVDEEGLLKDGTKCNPVGSYLYGTLLHGNPIVGDILLAVMGDDGDFVEPGPGEPEIVHDYVMDLISFMNDIGIDRELRERFNGITADAFPAQILSFDSVEDMAKFLGMYD